MMLAASGTTLQAEVPHQTAIDQRVKPLLDDIACELAREYVRLMEAAAADTNTDSGDPRR
jgi:hypothetical protein